MWEQGNSGGSSGKWGEILVEDGSRIKEISSVEGD
jgi:hypothetical protein